MNLATSQGERLRCLGCDDAEQEEQVASAEGGCSVSPGRSGSAPWALALVLGALWAVTRRGAFHPCARASKPNP